MKKLLLLFILFTLFNEAKSEIIQDPMRTSDNRKVNPDKNLDGSTGRYKKQHKHANGKKFATSKKHIKTAKPKGDHGKEKQNSTPKGETGG